MSDEKKYSEREVVKRERMASAKARCAALFARTRRTESFVESHHGYHRPGNPCDSCLAHARDRYPLPKVTRPRVVTDPNCHSYQFRWFVVPGFELGKDGCIQTKYKSDVCWTATLPTATPERIRVWADLLANPTEEVSVDE